MASIELVEVSKQYDRGQPIVDRMSLSIADGEFIVLVGPSGCGKSTTLRMIAGLESISAGELRIGGQRVNEREPGDRDIAMVFQNYALYPHMTVRENLAFGLRMRKVPSAEIDQRIGRVAQLLSIGELLARKPRQLSGGQRQRVAVGRAIVRQPVAFLFDEPLSNLDAKLRVQMRSELSRLHQQLKTTTVYVTHDQVEAMTLGDRIAVMNQGQIQQLATPLEIYRNPANQFVASFIGSPAMNFLPGHWQSGQFHTRGRKLNLTSGETPGLPDQELVLGIRPEHLTLEPAGLSLGPAQVRNIERLGGETYGYLDLSGQLLIARWPGDCLLESGQEILLFVQAHHWHLFSAEASGHRLLSGSG